MFSIRFAESAGDELEALGAHDRRRVLDQIKKQLSEMPTETTKHRKMLEGAKPSFEHIPPIWQLRVDPYRVFYDVDEEVGVVTVRAIREKSRRTTGEII